MTYLHPLIQAISTVLCAWALWLGSRRALSLHLGRRVAFDRARHARVGTAALLGLLLGTVVGVAVMATKAGAVFVTLPHGIVGAALMPLLLFGLATGLWMERRRKPRKLLPLLHGAANALLLAGALYQATTGKAVAEKFFGG